MILIDIFQDKNIVYITSKNIVIFKNIIINDLEGNIQIDRNEIIEEYIESIKNSFSFGKLNVLYLV